MITRIKAIKKSIQALQLARQKIAYDANLYKLGFATGPHFKNASREYTELTQAIEYLREVLDNGQKTGG